MNLFCLDFLRTYRYSNPYPSADNSRIPLFILPRPPFWSPPPFCSSLDSALLGLLSFWEFFSSWKFSFLYSLSGPLFPGFCSFLCYDYLLPFFLEAFIISSLFLVFWNSTMMYYRLCLFSFIFLSYRWQFSTQRFTCSSSGSFLLPLSPSSHPSF